MRRSLDCTIRGGTKISKSRFGKKKPKRARGCYGCIWDGKEEAEDEMGRKRRGGTAGWSFADADALADRNTCEIVSFFLPPVPRGIKGSRHKGDAAVKRDT